LNSDKKNNFRSVLRGFKVLAGYAGGIVGFFVSKSLAQIVNRRKTVCRITPEIANRLNPLFPGMQFSNIRIIGNAWLPAHLFNRSIEGMTFRNRIYVTHRDVLHTHAGFMLLVHELVHIKQIRESGEITFACRYGEQFLLNGGYNEKMPYEREAYEFVDKNWYQVSDVS
jgi:hypothetical protein